MMSFGERLKNIRINKGMTQEDLSRRMGVSVITIRNWESGRKRPTSDSVAWLAKTLNVSADVILGTDGKESDAEFSLTNSEWSLIRSYRALDDYGRRIVMTICEMEKERVDDERKARCIRYIPKYDTPSAAGAAVPLDAESFEMIAVEGNVPQDADFAVKIQGNSMEPYIFDGETVYVKRCDTVAVGEIGIFSVNGAMYCKQYFVDSKGNMALLSANESAKASNVYVGKDSGSKVVCYGRVILKQKTPLPDYHILNLSESSGG